MAYLFLGPEKGRNLVQVENTGPAGLENITSIDILGYRGKKINFSFFCNFFWTVGGKKKLLVKSYD